LEKAIGAEVRRYREQLGLGGAEFARIAGVSAAMLSRIERGLISPSIGTLEVLARSLRVPIAALFRGFDDATHAIFTKAGEGMKLCAARYKRGQCELLGASRRGSIVVESLLVTLSSEHDIFPKLPNMGIVWIYLTDGEFTYSHGCRQFPMFPGDALLFDARGSHGIASAKLFPIKLLVVRAYLH